MNPVGDKGGIIATLVLERREGGGKGLFEACCLVEVIFLVLVLMVGWQQEGAAGLALLRTSTTVLSIFSRGESPSCIVGKKDGGALVRSIKGEVITL